MFIKKPGLFTRPTRMCDRYGSATRDLAWSWSKDAEAWSVRLRALLLASRAALALAAR